MNSKNYIQHPIEQDRLVTIEEARTSDPRLPLMNPAPYIPEFSTAGFFQVDPTVREAANFNNGWRFLLGDAERANSPHFEDADWSVVNLPHGLELNPLDASGGVNYQGPAWYRKHFHLDARVPGKQHFIHFEAIMGSSRIWLNGSLVKERFGGFHPIHIDVTEALNYGEENVIAIRADNSDEPLVPPGKPQSSLDFTYFGGIYRDVWMITTSETYITNPNHVNKVAAGGVFVHCDAVSEHHAEVKVQVDVAHKDEKEKAVTIELKLHDREDVVVGQSAQDVTLVPSEGGKSDQTITVTDPHLWHVDGPYLHNLFVTIKDSENVVLDVLRVRVGIRSIEFRGKDGFFLNGKAFDDKLIGGNRHQDYAYIGNALPNSLHWRDAQKLRQGSMRIIRNAHYLQDPAFMDACDELGLFVIVNTPGWQFWNKEPVFGERVLDDIRNMVRRDRNHPSVFLWEPILNETNYPEGAAQQWALATHEEYPFSGCYTACDLHAKGQEHFDVIFSHPFVHGFWEKHIQNTPENRAPYAINYKDNPRATFTREWGDCVDNWRDHNSPSRMAKEWGEQAQLIQALHYSKTDSLTTNWDTLYDTPQQFVGGTLWHSFDHQRGYHPDTFWGGIMDATRQPKLSYQMFRSQMHNDVSIPQVDSGPFVYIAHELSPVSGRDIVVFSNCDEVRLLINDQEVGTLSTTCSPMPHEPVIFKDAFHFMSYKHFSRDGKRYQVTAEGLIDGEVVTKTTKLPAGRKSKVILWADTCGVPLTSDGSDILPIVAYLTDSDGRIKRLCSESIIFAVEGPGELIEDPSTQMNPQIVRWGEAVALVRASHEPGTIVVRASVLKEGINQPMPAELAIETVPATHRMIFDDVPDAGRPQLAAGKREGLEELQHKLDTALKEINEIRLREVERQQRDCEGTT